MISAKQEVKSRFSEGATEWAAYYADPTPPMTRRHLVSRQRFALEMLEAAIPPFARVLDAGCGPGVMTEKLMDRGYVVWGLDFAEPMVRQAREHCGSNHFGVGDIEHMPFPDDTFDAVVSLAVIEYLESDEQALREIRRVLKPGGTAVIAISNGRSPLLRLDHMFLKGIAVLRPAYHLVKYRLRGRPAPSPEAPTRTAAHRRFYRSRWLRLLQRLNFEPEEWICHGWGWPDSPLHQLMRFPSIQRTAFGRGLERLVGRARLDRAGDKFVRSRAGSWLAAEHVFRARAIK
jgi:ubiquinone/menaquinone biosynthesis C-methylase UbiE